MVKINADGTPETRAQKLKRIELLKEKKFRKAGRKIYTYFPNEGPLRRELYTKHIEFFSAGKDHRERLMLAANRVGKTESVGLYELCWHLMGEYPDWWDGYRFTRPITAWVAGDTGKTVREILQFKMLGPIDIMGTGVLPRDAIERTTKAAGVTDGIDTVYVKNKFGGTSMMTFKSYEQGRESFQGTERDVILLDEEPPNDIYLECLMRTMTNNGMILLTFTPLSGMSEVVLAFLPDGRLSEENPTKYVVMATWDDVPHLTKEAKDELFAALPPYQRDARSKGVPQLGAGAIYPVPETDFTVDDFKIPDHWPRVFGFDVGWNRTACVWGAIDLETSVLYLYSEYYRGQAEPVVHAEGVKSRGAWIPGVIDPAARGRGQKDGFKLFDMYLDLGLSLNTANNAVESGIYAVWSKLSIGELKVFKSMSNWLSEFRMYRRDVKGHVVKSNDHLMDCTRYLVISGIDIAEQKPVKAQNIIHLDYSNNKQNWMYA